MAWKMADFVEWWSIGCSAERVAAAEIGATLVEVVAGIVLQLRFYL